MTDGQELRDKALAVLQETGHVFTGLGMAEALGVTHVEAIYALADCVRVGTARSWRPDENSAICYQALQVKA